MDPNVPTTWRRDSGRSAVRQEWREGRRQALVVVGKPRGPSQLRGNRRRHRTGSADLPGVVRARRPQDEAVPAERFPRGSSTP